MSHAGKQECLCCEVFFLRTANYKQRRNVISGTFHTLLIWLLMMLWKREKKKKKADLTEAIRQFLKLHRHPQEVRVSGVHQSCDIGGPTELSAAVICKKLFTL